MSEDASSDNRIAEATQWLNAAIARYRAERSVRMVSMDRLVEPDAKLSATLEQLGDAMQSLAQAQKKTGERLTAFIEFLESCTWEDRKGRS